jgi:glycosyltransferase involved in cell wall biosynthesis
MRVAIDGRTIVHDRSGVGTYADQIVRWLLRLDSHNEYFLFLVTDAPGLEAPNLQKILIAGYDRMILNRWWENVLLPGYLTRHEIDVYFSPSYTLPILPRLGAVVAPVSLPQKLTALFNPRKTPRYVVTIHDVIGAIHPETFTPKMRMWQALFSRNAAVLADRLIAVSESTKRDFTRLYGPVHQDIVVVPHGLDERFLRVTDPGELQRVRQRYSLPAAFVLNVGTIEPRKNVTGLASAYALLPAEMRKRYPLVICGAHGWYSESILAEIQALGISDSIKMVGFAAHEDLPALYSLATLFVYPSLYEGFGYPPLEAMACGTPVITSNTSSLPEVVGDAGMLVAPRDTDALARHIERALSEPQLRRHLAQKGMERAKHFHWEMTAGRTLSVLKSAARNTPPRPRPHDSI